MRAFNLLTIFNTIFKQKKPTMELHIQALNISNTTRIGIINRQFDDTFPSKIKLIQGSRWSPVFRCWHIPYTATSWMHFKQIFDNVLIVHPAFDQKLPIALPQNNAHHQEAVTQIIQSVDKKEYIIETFFEQVSIDNISPILETIEKPTPPQYLTISNAITVSEHASDKNYWSIHLPVTMLDTHLETLKNIHGRRWNARWSAWDVPKTQLTVRFIEKYFADVVHWKCDIKQDLPDRLESNNNSDHARKAIKEQSAPARYENAVLALEEVLTLKRYSWRTIKGYTNAFRQYIRHFDDMKPSDLTRQHINQYILWCIKQKNITESYQNQILSAIKMFYIEVVPQEDKVLELIRPKKAHKLPQVLSEEEVVRLIKATDNLKHNTILSLIYSAGLRLGELINLRIGDIQPDNKRIFIRKGKGKKDRYTILSDKVFDKIKDYLQVYCPVDWLFEGMNGGQYSERSVQNVFTKSKELSRVNPYTTTHTLRHSFASHLYDKGYDIYIIKDLLGHEDIRTTEIYIQISKKSRANIKSPFDSLDI